MALSELQQAKAFIDRASDILLLTPTKASPDAAASLIALYLAIMARTTKMAEQPTIDAVSPSHLPQALQFLAGSSQIKVQPTQQPEVVLDIMDHQHVAHIRQEKLHGGLRLHLSFATGQTLTKDQLETSVRLLPYDTVLIIGALDLEEIGDLFVKHTDFFYNTPVINIDHRAANEHFGTVNLVDITAGSCAEVTYDLITTLAQEVISPDIATALYAGIVAGTDSFQHPSTTPRSFHVAAQLIEREANREAVIQHLIKTKPLRIIKLTGAIFARLRWEDQVQLYWTILEPADFQESGATSADIPQAMQELTNNIAGFAAAFLLYEANPSEPRQGDRQYVVYILLGKGLRSRRREVQEVLAATKQNGALTFTVSAASIEAAEKIAHDKLKQILP